MLLQDRMWLSLENQAWGLRSDAVRLRNAGQVLYLRVAVPTSWTARKRKC